MRLWPTDGGEQTPLLRRALPVLAILLGLSLSVGRDSLFPFLQGLQRANSIVKQSREYQRKIRDNDALAGEVRFLGTAQGARAALLKQGKLLPGQHQGRITVAATPTPAPPTQSQRFQGWILTTEERAARWLRDWGEALSCYAGCRPLDQPPESSNPPQKPLSKTGQPQAKPS